MSIKNEAVSLRAAEDMTMLKRAIELTEGRDDAQVFRDWLARLLRNDPVMRELGPKRRSYVRDTLAAGGVKKQPAASEPLAFQPGNKYVVTKNEMKDWGKRVQCGALPKFPPGMTADTRRNGEWRR